MSFSCCPFFIEKASLENNFTIVENYKKAMKMIVSCSSILLSMLFGAVLETALAQTTVEIPITFKSTVAAAGAATLKIGVDSRATDCIDKDLGEYDFPFFPPDGIAGQIVTTCSSTQETVYMQLDYRKLSTQNDSYMHHYAVKVQRRMGNGERPPLVITWPTQMPSLVKSATITNVFGLNVNMLTTDITQIDNQFLEDFDFNIEYYGQPTSVNEANENGDISVKISPNPATETVRITGKNVFDEYRIYSLCGREVQSGTLLNSEIPISNVERGIYFIEFRNSTSQKFEKQIIVKN